jgi:ribosomal protein S25
MNTPIIKSTHARRDMSGFDDHNLEFIIDGFKNGRHSDERLYVNALAEQGRRQHKGLVFDTTVAAIRAAAAERRFITYGEIASANGVSWSVARRPMNKHLEAVVEWAARNGLPLITAIVVDQPAVGTGAMSDSAMSGFMRAARKFGHIVTDERAFLGDQQQAVFYWARTA